MRTPIWPILKREYLSRILTKGFWISTALFPLLTLGFTILPKILTDRTRSSPEPIRIVDVKGDFYPVLRRVLDNADDAETSPPVELEDPRGRPINQIRNDLNAKAEKGEIQGYFVIDDASLRKSEVVYFARNPSSAISSDLLRTSLRESITRYRLMKIGVNGRQVEDAIQRVFIDIQKATNDPEKRESGVSAFFMSFALTMFIYFTLIFYGVYILRGVLEEKSNRIVEIMISSVKPFHLMIGKIFGIGLVGLTQIAIWSVFALLITIPAMAGLFMINKDAIPTVNPVAVAFFPVYFILGYFLYATIYAGIGSMFNSDEDAQQMVSVASLLLVVPMMLLMPVIKNPSGKLAIWLSLVPFFAPILMYLRINIQMPPAWQIALSIAIMMVTILVMVWLVSKIYRVGILMYGKKPTIPELIRWLRYT